MDYSSKKSLWKWILLYVFIGAVAYGAIYYFFFYNKGGYSYVLQNYQTQTQSPNPNLVVNDFTFKIGDSYADTKVKLLASGWLPVSQANNPIDPQFPEIGGCGEGVDAICNVDFKKGDMQAHLNVQIGGRPPYGSYSEWTVVGNE